MASCAMKSICNHINLPSPTYQEYKYGDDDSSSLQLTAWLGLLVHVEVCTNSGIGVRFPFTASFTHCAIVNNVEDYYC